MAKVKLNPVMENMSGKIGDLVFKRYEDEVVISRKPNREGLVPTTKQTAHQERFRLAAVYAKASFGDAVLRAVYETAAKEKNKPAFALAVGDFLNAPKVDAIDLTGYTGKVGEKIVIRASDDIEVVSVTVAIRSADGGVLEQGAAAFEEGSWRYTAQTALDLASGSFAVDVTAIDHPGNKTLKTQVKA
jgi:hypothetical protein